MNSWDVTFASQKWQHLAMNSNRRGSVFFIQTSGAGSMLNQSGCIWWGAERNPIAASQTPPLKKPKTKCGMICVVVSSSPEQRSYFWAKMNTSTWTKTKFMQHAAPHSWSLWATDATENERCRDFILFFTKCKKTKNNKKNLFMETPS